MILPDLPFIPFERSLTYRASWQRIAEEKIDRDFRIGVLSFQDGNDVSYEVLVARKERRKLVTRVVFLLNIRKVGAWAYMYAVNSQNAQN